ncbi:MAG: 50S ribosomal protein L29 [Elusimicrobiota bacterium]
MKAKEKEASKTLSLKELLSQLHDAQEKQFKLKFKHQVAPLKNPLEIKHLRRQIARLKTWINEKQEVAAS